MDYMSIGTMIGAILGVISFIMYFPLKRKEIKANTDNENVETLSKVVTDLQEELKRKNAQEQIDKKRIDTLEKGQYLLTNRINVLEKEIRDNDIAFSAITSCSWYKKGGKCPIIDKKNENKKGSKTGCQKEKKK